MPEKPEHLARTDIDRLLAAAGWEVQPFAGAEIALDEEFAYDPSQLDHDVVAPDQIRTLVRTFRDKRPTEIVPGRTAVPKTLIFANDRVKYREFQFVCFVDAAMLTSGARA